MPEEPTEKPSDAEATAGGDAEKTVVTKTSPTAKSASKKATPKKPAPKKAAAKQRDEGPLLTPFGIASAVQAVVCVAAVVLVTLMWSGHRDENAELGYRTSVLQTAAEWTSTLINLNPDNAEANLQTLRDGTVGQLNADFDSTLEPFMKVLQQVQATTSGQVESVAIETLHHDPETQSGALQPAPTQQPELAAYASRTDTVIVVATSVSENVAADPKTARWNLRLDVSEVDGRLLISRLVILQ